MASVPSDCFEELGLLVPGPLSSLPLLCSKYHWLWYNVHGIRTESTKVMIQKQYWNQLFSNFQECCSIYLTYTAKFSFPRNSKRKGGFLWTLNSHTLLLPPKMVVKEVFVVCQNVFCQQGQGEQFCSIGIEVRDMCQHREE